MVKVLNKGLKFAITPLKLDITQVLTEFRRFERTMVWWEFWYGKNTDQPYKPSIFKQKKCNFPRNRRPPRGLTDYLAAVKSDLVDPKNRHQAKSNLTEGEKEALKELVKLQKQRIIVIRPCDKGAGIIILDFQEYIKACENHLGSKTKTEVPYYVKADARTLEEAKEAIENIVKEGFDNDIINKDEYKAMLPEEDIKPGRFYATFKVHKTYTPGTAPPERAIVSCSGTFTENIAIYVEHHLQEVGTSHDTYLQDTPDFLRKLQKINLEEKLPEHALLVVIDAIGLYTNIPQQEGVQCVEEALDERVCQVVPSSYITRLLEIILKNSIFEFNNELYQQQVGTTMGTKPAPRYANVFMDRRIDRKLWQIAKKYMVNGSIPIKFMKRFLDDIFLIFLGSITQLHAFFDEMNQMHPTIKFTMTHTTPASQMNQISSCTCDKIEAIPFLDTLCKIKDGQISTDLYRKPSDRNQYLLPSSCHPIECTKSIPYSLSTRIVRVCSEPSERDARFLELKEMLIEREYTPRMIDAAISRAKEIPRDEALKCALRQQKTNRPVFVVTFDPRLPSIPKITRKHWRSMVSQENYLANVFPEAPLVAFRRQRNIRENIIKAKVAPNTITRERRMLNGMKKCGKCIICSYVKEGNTIKSNNFTWKINKKVTCQNSNVIYLIQCNKEQCKQQYIGFTTKVFRERMKQHLGYVRNKVLTQATGTHFNLKGHSKNNMEFTIVEKVRSMDPLYGREREKLHIRKFNSFHGGINREP